MPRGRKGDEETLGEPPLKKELPALFVMPRKRRSCLTSKIKARLINPLLYPGEEAEAMGPKKSGRSVRGERAVFWKPVTAHRQVRKRNPTRLRSMRPAYSHFFKHTGESMGNR